VLAIVLALVSALGSAAFSVLAGLLLGERPGMLAVIAIVLALPAIVAISTSSRDADPVDSTRGRAPTGRHALGVVLGLIAGAGFAGLFIALNQAGSSHDLWPIVTSQGAAFVCAFIAAAAARQLSRPTARTGALAGLTGTTGAVGTIFTSSPPISVCWPSPRSSPRSTRPARSCWPAGCWANG
jgi:drug/metabolite transporter (DMT)-like permease